MDPALHLALRVSLSLLLTVAVSHKLRDPARFRAVLTDYDVLPLGVVAVAAPLVVLVEASLALLLLLGAAPLVVGLGAALLFLVYGASIQVNVTRGRADIDCGCMGPASRVPLSEGLVVRNLLLALAAACLVLPPSSRRLGWLDAVTIAAATGILALCWQAGERLLALAPGMARLRRRSR